LACASYDSQHVPVNFSFVLILVVVCFCSNQGFPGSSAIVLTLLTRIVAFRHVSEGIYVKIMKQYHTPSIASKAIEVSSLWFGPASRHTVFVEGTAMKQGFQF
jgi:hypothetical protein